MSDACHKQKRFHNVYSSFAGCRRVWLHLPVHLVASRCRSGAASSLQPLPQYEACYVKAILYQHSVLSSILILVSRDIHTTRSCEMASERLGEVLTLAATGVQIAGTAALDYVQGHPARVGLAAVSVGLTPILGAGWVVALPLKAIGFGQAGVGAGRS